MSAKLEKKVRVEDGAVLASLSIVVLRRLGKLVGISYWYSLNKNQLVVALVKRPAGWYSMLTNVLIDKSAANVAPGAHGNENQVAADVAPSSGTGKKAILPGVAIGCGIPDGEVGQDVVRVGRPVTWSDPKKLLESINQWISSRKKRKQWQFVPKIGGQVKVLSPLALHEASLCNWLGIAVRTWQRWKATEEHPFFSICEMTMVAIEADLWDQDSPMARLNLQSNFGHKTRNDLTTQDQELPEGSTSLNFDFSKLSTDELNNLLDVLNKGEIDSDAD